MILNVFGSNFDLPSVDLKSLQMMAFAKFFKMDIEIRTKTFRPYVECKLPELIFEKGSITDLQDYIEYLKFETLGSNSNSENLNSMKLDKRYKPYEILFQETLKPALLNTLWVEDKNFNEVTRGTFSKVCRFPLNYFVPNFLRNSAIEYMEKVYPLKNRKQFFEIELIEKAKDVLKLLSENLGDSKYFNSQSPNEIDALIFGYLAVISKVELSKLNNLQQFLKEHKNLTEYVNRISKEFFPVDQVKRNEIKDVKVNSNFEVASTVSWKSLIFVTSAAIVSNFLYICYTLDEEEADEEDF